MSPSRSFRPRLHFIVFVLRVMGRREHEVVEAILRVQPQRVDSDATEPHELSGAPPGGDAYLRPG